MAARNLFVYGALMYDEVWDQLVSGKYRKIRAELAGYRRLKMRGEVYPGVVEGDGSVRGFVWLNVQPEDLRRLDRFEGRYYERVEELVKIEKRKGMKVDVYRIRKQYRSMVEDVEWDRKHFEKSGLKGLGVQGSDRARLHEGPTLIEPGQAGKRRTIKRLGVSRP